MRTLSHITLSASLLLCGLGFRGKGTYTAEGISAIAEMLKVNSSLVSIRWAEHTLRHSVRQRPLTFYRHSALVLQPEH